MKRLNLELTNFCNFHCTICGDKKQRPISNMGYKDVERILNNVKQNGLNPEIRLFISGEPLFSPIITSVISLCALLGFKVLIHTNGSMINNHEMHEINCSGIGKNLTISVSLDGGNAEAYFAIRGQKYAMFSGVSEKIKKLIACCACNVQVQCIIPVDQKHMEKSIFDRYSNMFAGAKISVRTPHNWAEKDSVPGSEQRSYSKCDFIDNDLVIYSDGKVGLCCACLNQEITFGNIADYDYDVTKAFTNPELMQIRRHYKGKTIPESVPCFNCERYNHG